jgi:hypothetical protein
MRKFKITSSHSGTISFVQSQRMLETVLVHCAYKAHPKSPVVITVEDVTEDQSVFNDEDREDDPTLSYIDGQNPADFR